jgi:hypothetical protein
MNDKIYQGIINYNSKKKKKKTVGKTKFHEDMIKLLLNGR